MRGELEDILMRDFPFTQGKNLFSGKKTGYPIGCDCDDGWFELIYNCFKEIDKLYKEKKENVYELMIYQIKEKYGGLHIYLGNYIEGVDKIVDKYGEKSYTTCEICGQLGKTMCSGIWLKTLCDKHAKQYNFKECKYGL